jgi:cysteine synthase B
MTPGADRLPSGIGGTPLVELDLDGAGSRGGRLFAKLESVNPGGSIKDRPVARILRRALSDGSLAHGRRLLDSSSGNAGISYAQLGAALGVPVTLVVPANASRERLQRIAAHGAELVLTDPIEGYDHAIHTARRLAAERPDLYWYADQYGNDENWRAHFDTTGAEIVAQVTAATDRPPDVFVAGVGTGGTLTGVGRRLRDANPGLTVVAVVPELFPGIEGLKPLGHAGDLVPRILDQSLIERRVEVTHDEAAAVCRDLARHGLFVGPSSGACVLAARRVAREVPGALVVTVLSDTGERYASTGLWDPQGAVRQKSRDWLREPVPTRL